MSKKTNLVLSVKQLRLIAYLLSSIDVKTACQRARVSRATYQRWMLEDPFINELNHARDEMISNIETSFLAGCEIAKGTILSIMTNEIYSESVRLRCAIAWFDQWFKINEVSNLTPRIEKLEEMHNDIKTKN